MTRLLTLSLLLLTACDPVGALWLRVEAPLAIPSQVDRLHVQVSRLEDQHLLYDQTHALNEAHAFPLTLSLTTDDPRNVGSEKLLSVTVTALLGEAQATGWSQRSQELELTRGEISEAVVRLCDCDPNQ